MRPHEVVNNIADTVANTVKGLGNGVVRTAEGASGQITRALDKPFEMVIHKESPFHMVDDVVSGTLSAISGFADDSISALQNEGHAFMRALDEPPKNFGFPPDLGGSSFKMPKLPGRK